MTQKIFEQLRKVWAYIRELEDYKWKHGSSCCTPVHTNPDDDLFTQHSHS